VPPVNPYASSSSLAYAGLKSRAKELFGINLPDDVSGNEYEHVGCIEERESLDSVRSEEVRVNMIDKDDQQGQTPKEIDPSVTPA